jgi:hypothetical protein
MNETRVKLYERLMEAEEQIAHSRYDVGMSHETVLAALDAAESTPSEAERSQDLFLSELSAFVSRLGGHLELHAVFADGAVVILPRS